MHSARITQAIHHPITWTVTLTAAALAVAAIQPRDNVPLAHAGVPTVIWINAVWVFCCSLLLVPVTITARHTTSTERQPVNAMTIGMVGTLLAFPTFSAITALAVVTHPTILIATAAALAGSWLLRRSRQEKTRP